MSQLSSFEELFAGRHFDQEVIILCVRWYLRYKLSFRDLVEMMAERGLNLAHTTILRWVRRYAPEFVKRWNRFGRSAGRSSRVDETDRLQAQPDTRLAAAKAFFTKAIRHHRGVKTRSQPMLGFKNFKPADITIAGVELLRRIHKDQFALNRLHLKGQAAPAIWNAVLAA